MTKRKQPTFKDLQDQVATMEIVRGNLADRLDDILDRARWNADDTCHREKAQPVENYDAVALATVSDVLSCGADKEVCDWFAGHGVTW